MAEWKRVRQEVEELERTQKLHRAVRLARVSLVYRWVYGFYVDNPVVDHLAKATFRGVRTAQARL